jgi:hypothetical protein
MSKETAPLLGGSAATQTAAGTTQTTAAAVTGDNVHLPAVAASAGIILQLGNGGDSGWVTNGDLVNSLKVYPPVGGQFNGYTVNSPAILPPNSALIYKVIAPLTISIVMS